MPVAAGLARGAHAPGGRHPRAPRGGLRARRRPAPAAHPARAGGRRGEPRRRRPRPSARRAGLGRRLQRRRPRAQAAGRPRLPAGADGAGGRRLLRWLAHAPEPGAGADVSVRSAAARRADQPPRPRRHPLARGVAEELSRHPAADLPRPRLPRCGGRPCGASRAAEAQPVPRRLLGLRARPRRASGPAAAGLREAADAARAHGRLHPPLQGQGQQGAPGAEPHQGAGAPRGAGAGAHRLAVRLRVPRGRQGLQSAARSGRGPPRLRRQDRARQGQAAAGARRAHRPARPQRRRQVDPDQDPGRRAGAARRAPDPRREPRGRLLRPAPARLAGRQGQPAAAPAAHRPRRARAGPARLHRRLRLPW
ncbi:hypothetical protein D3C81_1063810 [compost metagenome]